MMNIIKVIRNHDQECLENILSTNIDVNKPCYDSQRSLLRLPLLVAVELYATELVRLLLDHGADPCLESTEEEPSTALSVALFLESTEILSLFIDHGIDINHVLSVEGITPLMLEVDLGNSHLVQFLIEKGADVNQVCRGVTPLIKAIENKNEKIMDILLRHGARTDQTDAEISPFATALLTNDFDVLRLFVSYAVPRGLDINGTIEGFSEPGLLFTAKISLLDSTKALIAANCDVNVTNAHGETALHAAVQNQMNSPVVQLLLKAGCNAFIQSRHGDGNTGLRHGNTALHLACHFGNLPAVQLLFTHMVNEFSNKSVIPDAIPSFRVRSRSPGYYPLEATESRGQLSESLMPNDTSANDGDGNRTSVAESMVYSFQEDAINSYRQRNASVPGNLSAYRPITSQNSSIFQRFNSLCSASSTIHSSQVPHYGLARLGPNYASYHTSNTGLNQMPHHQYWPFTSNSLSLYSAASEVLAISNAQWHTPLGKAVLAGKIDILCYFLAIFKHISRYIVPKNNQEVELLLHKAVSAGQLEVVKFLLRHGYNIDKPDRSKSDETPLILSARMCYDEIVLYLIEQGANMNAMDSNKETALSSAVYFGFEKNVGILIRNGADTNVADLRGTTPMYWAVFNARVKSVRLLLEVGTHFSKQDFNRIPRNLKIMRNQEIFNLMQDYVSNAKSLQNLCVVAIRHHLSDLCQGRSIVASIKKLGLPKRIESMVLLEGLFDRGDT